jgi:hypothetical protein
MHGPLLHMPSSHAHGHLETLSLPLLPFTVKLWQCLNRDKYLIICIIQELFQESMGLLLDFFYIMYRHRHQRILGARQCSTITNIFGTSGYRGQVRGGGEGSYWRRFISPSPGWVVTWWWPRCTTFRLPSISCNTMWPTVWVSLPCISCYSSLYITAYRHQESENIFHHIQKWNQKFNTYSTQAIITKTLASPNQKQCTNTYIISRTETDTCSVARSIFILIY